MNNFIHSNQIFGKNKPKLQSIKS